MISRWKKFAILVVGSTIIFCLPSLSNACSGTSEPSLSQIVSGFDGTGFASNGMQTFPAGQYTVTLVAKYSGYPDDEVFVDLGVNCNQDIHLFTASDPVGAVMNFTAERDFALGIKNGYHSFLFGSANFSTKFCCNSDWTEHARVGASNSGGHFVGFEDLFWGGDRDYQDMVIWISPDVPPSPPSPPPDPPTPSEPSLCQILAERGVTNCHDNGLEVFPAGDYQSIGLIAAYAGYASQNSLSVVSSCTQEGGVEIFAGGIKPGTSVDFNSADNFIFRLNSPDGVFYSQTSCNPDIPAVRHIFVVDNPEVPGGFYVGFEDLLGGGDQDFQDMVISLIPVDTTIEPVLALTATPIEGAEIRLNWIISGTSNVTVYNIYSNFGTGEIDYSTPLGSVAQPGITFTTSGLTPGIEYQFIVVASTPSGTEVNSNIVSAVPFVSCSEGTITAVIKNPHTGKKISGNRVNVMAEFACGTAEQTQQILFQYHPAEQEDWIDIVAANKNHPNPDTSSPYFTHWDVTTLADGEYAVRAVASNLSGVPDPNPGFITVTIDNANPTETQSTDTSGEITVETQVQDTQDNLLVVGDENQDQIEKVKVDKGAVNGKTNLVYSHGNENPALAPSDPIFSPMGEIPIPEIPYPSGYLPVGGFRTLTLQNGETILNNSTYITLTLPYADADNDGYIDGTQILVSSLHFFILNQDGVTWNAMATIPDQTAKQVTGLFDRTGTIGLFGYEPPTASSSGQTIDLDIFGIKLSYGANCSSVIDPRSTGGEGWLDFGVLLLPLLFGWSWLKTRVARPRRR